LTPFNIYGSRLRERRNSREEKERAMAMLGKTKKGNGDLA
jgi:hypothetical protein